MHSIEGKRGMPRPRPPFPAASGLFGKPTVINNVETLANVPGLMAHGRRCLRRGRHRQEQGHQGVRALRHGQPHRPGRGADGHHHPQIVFDIGGGIPNGKKCKAVQIGGPSGGCIPEPQLDIAVDYEALKKLRRHHGLGRPGRDGREHLHGRPGQVLHGVHPERELRQVHPVPRGHASACSRSCRPSPGPRRKEDGHRRPAPLPGRHVAEAAGARRIRNSSLCGLGQTAPNPVLSHPALVPRRVRGAHLRARAARPAPARSWSARPARAAARSAPRCGATSRTSAAASTERPTRSSATRIRSRRSARACATIPCEDVCRCGTTGGEPIAVRALKRYVVDHVDPVELHGHRQAREPDAPRRWRSSAPVRPV